jgi:hypothetical protein
VTADEKYLAVAKAAGCPADQMLNFERAGVPSLQHDPNRPEDVLKVDADEDGVGGDDCADALRYLMATKARTVTQRGSCGGCEVSWSTGSPNAPSPKGCTRHMRLSR